MAGQYDRDERAQVHTFESAVIGNDVVTAKRMLEAGFRYEKYSWPRSGYDNVLKGVVDRGYTEMYFLLKQHGMDFRYLDNDVRYQLKLEILERDIRFSALQEELKETKAEVTVLRDLVSGLSEKLEKLDGPKLDKPRPSLKR
jgi:hypothetical protein